MTQVVWSAFSHFIAGKLLVTNNYFVIPNFQDEEIHNRHLDMKKLTSSLFNWRSCVNQNNGNMDLRFLIEQINLFEFQVL